MRVPMGEGGHCQEGSKCRRVEGFIGGFSFSL